VGWYNVTFQQGVNGYTGCKDVCIVSWFPDTNYDGGPNDHMQVRTNDQLAGLIRFDVSSIPAHATVTRAMLSVYVDWRYVDRATNVEAYEVYREWIAAQATWNRATSSVLWGRPGCNDTTTDRAAQPEYSVPMYLINQWYDFHLTNLVQKWVSDPSLNRGLVFKAFGDAPAAIEMVTSEHGGVWMHPKLTVNYTLPTSTPTATSTNTRWPYPPPPTATGTPSVAAYLPLILRNR